MTEQERLQQAQAFIEELRHSFGVEISVVNQPEQLNDGLIQCRAVPVLKLVSGWQAPQSQPLITTAGD